MSSVSTKSSPPPRYSLTEAGRALDRVVDEAAAIKGPVELLRDGEPIGVVLSLEEYRALAERAQTYLERHSEFLEKYGDLLNDEDLDLSDRPDAYQHAS